MSVLIKDMNMPTNCWDCPLINTKPCPCKGYSTALEYVTRCHADCPLVPVPEHGRLIDADALEDLVIALRRDAIHAYEWTGKSGEWSTRIAERERFAVTIEDAPTIIPADKEGEG